MEANHHLTKDFEEKKSRKKTQTEGKGIQK
jgi:hypothetical protein